MLNHLPKGTSECNLDLEILEFRFTLTMTRVF